LTKSSGSVIIYSNKGGIEMSEETISAEQIEGLEELITKIVGSKIAQVSSEVEDIEQLKKSPAGTIIRLEERVNALDEKIDEIRVQMVTRAEFAAMVSRLDNIESRLDDMVTKTEFDAVKSRIDNIESKMATKQDLERMATKEEQSDLAQEVKALSVRMEEFDKRLTFFQIVTYSAFGVFFAMMVSILVKLFWP
jgi:tetrahydromethanopterin S-methyltransferase subunit G